VNQTPICGDNTLNTTTKFQILFFFFVFANPNPLANTPILSPSSYVSQSPSQIDVSVQDAYQITPLSSNVPLEAPSQTTPQSSTFNKGKGILVSEDLPQSINPLKASLNEPKKKKQKKSEWELNRVYQER
jgi:hypothetical protein